MVVRVCTAFRDSASALPSLDLRLNVAFGFESDRAKSTKYCSTEAAAGEAHVWNTAPDNRLHQIFSSGPRPRAQQPHASPWRPPANSPKSIPLTAARLSLGLAPTIHGPGNTCPTHEKIT